MATSNKKSYTINIKFKLEISNKWLFEYQVGRNQPGIRKMLQTQEG